MLEGNGVHVRAAVAHGVDDDRVARLVDGLHEVAEDVLVGPVGIAAEIGFDAGGLGVGLEHVGGLALGHAVDDGLGGVHANVVGVEALVAVDNLDDFGTELRADLAGVGSPEGHGDAQVHLAGLAVVVEELHLRLVATTVVEAGDAIGVGCLLKLEIGCDPGLVGGGRKLGEVVEHVDCIGEVAVEGTVLVVIDSAAFGHGGVLVDAAEVEERLVDDLAVAGCVGTVDGGVGELLVEALVVGRAVGPGAQVHVLERIIRQTGVGGNVVVTCLHIGIEADVKLGHIAVVFGLCLDVVVTVHEARRDHHAAEVHHVRVGADEGVHVGVGAYGNDGVALNGDGGGHGPGVVDGVDGGVLEHEVGGVLHLGRGFALGSGLGLGALGSGLGGAVGACGERGGGGGGGDADEVAAGHLCGHGFLPLLFGRCTGCASP